MAEFLRMLCVDLSFKGPDLIRFQNIRDQIILRPQTREVGQSNLLDRETGNRHWIKPEEDDLLEQIAFPHLGKLSRDATVDSLFLLGVNLGLFARSENDILFLRHNSKFSISLILTPDGK